MATSRRSAEKIAFHYPPTDSTVGVARSAAKRFAEHWSVDETQAIDLALCDMAVQLLPQYEAEDGRPQQPTRKAAAGTDLGHLGRRHAA